MKIVQNPFDLHQLSEKIRRMKAPISINLFIRNFMLHKYEIINFIRCGYKNDFNSRGLVVEEQEILIGGDSMNSDLCSPSLLVASRSLRIAQLISF